MTTRPAAQRIAELLIRAACRRLPGDVREERRREWSAELLAILHDPDIRIAALRRARALRSRPASAAAPVGCTGPRWAPAPR